MQPYDNSPEQVDRLDADAVCEQCDTVNPPGTLFCRTCGENLRDQRLRRLASPEAAPIAESPVRPRRVLAGLLTIFGLLLIIWVAMKVADGTIESWLTDRLTEATITSSLPLEPREFWTGSSARVFDELVRDLENNPVTLDEIRSGGKGVSEGFDGRYFLTAKTGMMGLNQSSAPVIGYANVRTDGNMVYVVAKLGARIEMRAQGELREGLLTTTLAAIRQNDSYIPVMGYARVGENGTLECFGQTAATNFVYTALAHRVP